MSGFHLLITLWKAFLDSEYLFFLCLFKSMRKNGQISSMTSLNGPSEDNTPAEGVCFRVSALRCVWLWVMFLWLARVSGSNVCVCLCLGFWTVATAVAEGKLVCVGSVFSVCVCVCRCLHGSARSTWSSNPFVNTRGTFLGFSLTQHTPSLFLSFKPKALKWLQLNMDSL